MTMTETKAGWRAWRLLAACRSLEPKEAARIFFPASEVDLALEAKTVCATCPVRVACLEFALANREEHGVWGGATAKERRSIARRRRLRG